MTTDEFSSHIIDPFQKIATCNLRILINIIWLYIHIPTQPHKYIHTYTRVAVITEIFALGLGKFTLICHSPTPIASHTNKMPRMIIMVSHYQTTTNTEKSKQFSAEANKHFRSCKFSISINPGAF